MPTEAGRKLKEIREQLGLSTTYVYEQSRRIAESEKNNDFIISTPRLAQIENEESVPSVFKLYSLSLIYRVSFSDVLRLFGLDVAKHPSHQRLLPPLRTQPVQMEFLDPNARVKFPARFDPAFDLRTTQFLNHVIETWGELPLAFLERLNPRQQLYGYIGLTDRIMYPLIRPGSFVVIDNQKIEVAKSGWSNEFERPIYFVELRRGYRCCWCQKEGTSLLLIPHPLSGCKIEIHPYPDEAEIIGRVVGVAMRIAEPGQTITGRRGQPRLP